MGPLGSRDLAPGAPGALLASPTPVALVSGAEEGAVVLPGCAPWIGTGCSPTVTGWKPARGLPLAEVPTTQTAHVAPSRGSCRATTSGGAWRPPPADAEPGLRRAAGAPRCRQRPPNERHQGAGASRLASARASGVGALWAACGCGGGADGGRDGMGGKEKGDGQVCPYGRGLSDCRQYPGGIDVCAPGPGSGG